MTFTVLYFWKLSCTSVVWVGLSHNRLGKEGHRCSTTFGPAETRVRGTRTIGSFPPRSFLWEPTSWGAKKPDVPVETSCVWEDSPVRSPSLRAPRRPDVPRGSVSGLGGRSQVRRHGTHLRLRVDARSHRENFCGRCLLRSCDRGVFTRFVRSPTHTPWGEFFATKIFVFCPSTGKSLRWCNEGPDLSSKHLRFLLCFPCSTAVWLDLS